MSAAGERMFIAMVLVRWEQFQHTPVGPLAAMIDAKFSVKTNEGQPIAFLPVFDSLGAAVEYAGSRDKVMECSFVNKVEPPA